MNRRHRVSSVGSSVRVGSLASWTSSAVHEYSGWPSTITGGFWSSPARNMELAGLMGAANPNSNGGVTRRFGSSSPSGSSTVARPARIRTMLPAVRMGVSSIVHLPTAGASKATPSE